MIQLINKIIAENNNYLKELAFFKTSKIDPEKIKGHYAIKTEADFIDIKSKTIRELEATLASLTTFLTDLPSKQDPKNELLKLHDLFGLTNGKYYDFALNHDIYSDLEPEFYHLIKVKLETYLVLDEELTQANT